MFIDVFEYICIYFILIAQVNINICHIYAQVRKPEY